MLLYARLDVRSRALTFTDQTSDFLSKSVKLPALLFTAQIFV